MIINLINRIFLINYHLTSFKQTGNFDSFIINRVIDFSGIMQAE